MYGDPDELERLAVGIREQAQGVREQAQARLQRSEQATWASSAAEEWRQRVREETTHANTSADTLDEAAQALIAHAAEVRERLAAIAAAEKAVTGWFKDRWNDLERVASTATGDAVRGIETAAQELRDGWASLPPPGDARWLELKIGG
ncbi:hypothetical protein ACIB24_22470 [Spongisporangium articulatum]|uniref:Uncharacterized protein n=1 Tax=Spongisporangium articulatum TaxID=3362603 RepID=A0ABW8ATX2_9ACTN